MKAKSLSVLNEQQIIFYKYHVILVKPVCGKFMIVFDIIQAISICMM
jgi:hypothetical protein